MVQDVRRRPTVPVGPGFFRQGRPCSLCHPPWAVMPPERRGTSQTSGPLPGEPPVMNPVAGGAVLRPRCRFQEPAAQTSSEFQGLCRRLVTAGCPVLLCTSSLSLGTAIHKCTDRSRNRGNRVAFFLEVAAPGRIAQNDRRCPKRRRLALSSADAALPTDRA
jgi:hypothetical protein